MAEDDEGLEPIKTEPVWSTDEGREVDDSLLGMETDLEFRSRGDERAADERDKSN
jgi:hypothetical protein